MGEQDLSAWLEFYRPFFVSEVDLDNFVRTSAAQSGPYLPSRIIMHQVRRLVTLADDVLAARPGRHSLAIFWLIVCAEAVTKLHRRDHPDRRSEAAVQHFFETFTSPEEQETLGSGLVALDTHFPLGLAQAVKKLYEVRCDVVHEGNYWDFTFIHKGTNMLNVEYGLIAAMELSDLRWIVVQGGVRASRSLWPAAT